jgi:uncharacterized membrane protein YoaK (UPF0700 family)
MRPRVITPGVYLLTATCGMVDAACFLALGGVFAEIMTGNLLLLAFSIGEGSFVEDWHKFVSALVCFALGAIAGGRLLHMTRLSGRYFSGERRHGFVLQGACMALATVLTFVWQPSGESVYARIVVGILAFAMGVQNAMIRRHGVSDVATNVMTVTFTGLLADSRIAGGDGARWKRRAGSVALFLVGASVGAALVQFGAQWALLAATLVFASALPWLLRGLHESQVQPQAS